MSKGLTRPHKIFDVYINSHLYPVWSIEGKEHGGWNGGPKTWWLWYSKEPVGVANFDDSKWVPYEDAVIPRLVWEIDYKQRITSKMKWGDHSFSQNGHCKMIANGRVVYAFPSRSLEYALSRVVVLKTQLAEHPFDFLSPEKEQGRKVWYKGQPATLKIKSDEPWEITIKPDTDNVDAWWSAVIGISTVASSAEEKSIDVDYWLEWKSYGEINHGDALADGEINWFRK